MAKKINAEVLTAYTMLSLAFVLVGGTIGTAFILSLFIHPAWAAGVAFVLGFLATPPTVIKVLTALDKFQGGMER